MLALLPFILIPNQNAVEKDRAIALCDAAFTYRALVKSYDVSLVVDYYGNGRAPENTQRFHVWFDRDRLRQDEFKEFSGYPGGPTRSIECRNCEGGRCFRHTILHGTKSLQNLLAHKCGDEPAENLLHPLRLGLVPANFANIGLRPTREIVGSDDPPTYTISEDSPSAGFTTLAYTVGGPTKCTCTTVLSKSQAGQVTDVSIETGGYKETLSTQYQFDEPSKIWFPKSVTYSIHNDGKYSRGEVVTVNVHSLNKPVPDSVFSIAGMDLPAGTIVKLDSRLSPTMWNGSEMVAPDRPLVVTTDTDRPLTQPADTGPFRRAAAAGGACFLLAAAGLYYYSHKRKRSAA